MALTVPNSGIVVRAAAEQPVVAPKESGLAFETSRFALEAHKGPVSALRFFSNSNLLLSGSADRTALLWDLESEEFHAVLALRGAKKALTDGVILEERCEAALSDVAGEIHVHDLSDGTRIGRLREAAGRKPAACHALVQLGANEIASACSDGAVRLWDVRGCTRRGASRTLVLGVADGKRAPPVLTIDSVRENVLTTGSLNGAVRLLDIRADSTKSEIVTRHSGMVSGVCVGEDGAGVGSLGEDGLRITDSRAFVGKKSRERAHIAGARAQFDVNLPRVAWRGNAVAAASSDGILRCWAVDGSDSEMVAVHDRRAAPLTTVAIHHTVDAVASGAEDGSIHLAPLGVCINEL